MTGYVRIDDIGEVYVDGIHVGSPPNYFTFIYFPVPDDWQILAILGVNSAGYAAIVSKLGDDVYSDVTKWRCSSSSAPGWNDIGFDDSSWSCPKKISDSKTSRDGPMYPHAIRIWCVDGGGKCYCRTSKIPRCNLPVNRNGLTYYDTSTNDVSFVYTSMQCYLAIVTVVFVYHQMAVAVHLRTMISKSHVTCTPSAHHHVSTYRYPTYRN